MMEISEYFERNRELKNRKSYLNKEDNTETMSKNGMNEYSSVTTGNKTGGKKWTDRETLQSNNRDDKKHDKKYDKNNHEDDKKYDKKQNKKEDNRDKNRNTNRDNKSKKYDKYKDKPKDNRPPLVMFNPNNPTKITETNKSDNKPDIKSKGIDTSTPEGKIQFNVRTAQGYLNKMTNVTFDTLSAKFLEISIQETELPGLLKLLIDRIFEQALFQPTFCPMYSSLCEKIHKETKNFRMLLLNKCQEEFERGSKNPSDDLTDVEKEDFRYKAKKRMLGNIKFIGELYKANVIVEPVMYECFNHLLKEHTREHNKNPEADPESVPDEEQVEALCKLMLNVGKILDPKANNKRIDNYINQMKEISNVSLRVKFLLQDVFDIRNNNWNSIR